VPLHRQPVFASIGFGAGTACPVADALAASVLSLPVHPGVGPAERQYIVESMNEVAT